MPQPRPSSAIAVALVMAGLSAPAFADVTRLEIARREVVLQGRAFGAAGPYEKLVGTVHFALDT